MTRGQIIGPRYGLVSDDPHSILDRFDVLGAAKLLINLNELTFKDRHGAAYKQKLLSLVTDSHKKMERKGRDAEECANYTRIWGTSNHLDCVQILAGEGERRFFITHASPESAATSCTSTIWPKCSQILWPMAMVICGVAAGAQHRRPELGGRQAGNGGVPDLSVPPYMQALHLLAKREQDSTVRKSTKDLFEACNHKGFCERWAGGNSWPRSHWGRSSRSSRQRLRHMPTARGGSPAGNAHDRVHLAR